MKYYYIDCDGEIMEEEWNGNEVDKARKKFGNYFKTKNIAEKIKRKVEKILKQS